MTNRRPHTSVALLGAVALLVMLSGCSDTTQNEAAKAAPVNEPPAAVQPAPAVQPAVAPAPNAALNPPQEKEPTTEELATTHLKTFLDAWKFGDSYQDFEESHPDLNVSDLDWIAHRHILINYDIGQSRTKEGKSPDGKPTSWLEFVVTLTHTNNAGEEIKKNKRYSVYPPLKDDKWSILGVNQ
jgi:hypothetical protein